MEKETKLQILESAMDLAYQRLAALKAEDMGGETVARLLEQLSNIGCLHDRVMYPYKPLHIEDDPAPTFEEPEQSYPTPEPDTEPKGDTETAAETPTPATKTLVEVRTILSELADKVDMPAILAQLGADKLSSVDPAKYEDLLAAARNAAKEA